MRLIDISFYTALIAAVIGVASAAVHCMFLALVALIFMSVALVLAVGGFLFQEK